MLSLVLFTRTTDPDEASTLPKRTMQNRTELCRSCNACKVISAKRLVAPMTLVGLTALSVETSTNVSTFASIAALAVCSVPKILL